MEDKLDKIIVQLDRIFDLLNQKSRYPKIDDLLTRQDPATPWPWTYTGGITTCSKCGLRLEGVMGYVCTQSGCPTFMVVNSILETDK